MGGVCVCACACLCKLHTVTQKVSKVLDSRKNFLLYCNLSETFPELWFSLPSFKALKGNNVSAIFEY